MNQTGEDPRAAGPDGCKAILVVEDDPDIRETLQSVLEEEGYATHAASNGRDALDRLTQIDRPCLILLDLMMPVMNGVDFLSHLRGDDGLAPIPVVVVSAWPKEADNVAEHTQGFVKKPVDLETLLAFAEKYC